MRVVVTRPVEDAERIATPLRERGVDVLVEPLLAIVPRAGMEVDTRGIQALLLTSANGVRALAGALGSDPVPRHLPALAVGDQTAAVARELGFVTVSAAEGDVESLAALARATLNPQGGPLLHAAGNHVAGDLAGMLKADGFTVRKVQLYESRTAAGFSAEFREALRQGAVDAVLLYSPRTAKTFATLAEQGELRDACRTVTAYCLSPAVADALGDVTFAAVRVAPRPEQEALLALFDQDNHARFRPAAGAGLADPEGERTMSDRPAGSGETPKTQEAKDAKAPPPKVEKPTSPPPKTDPPKVESAKADPAKTDPAKTEPSKTEPGKTGGPTKEGGAKGGLIAVGAVLLVLILLYASLPWWRDALPPQAQGFADAILPPAQTDTALRDEVDSLQAAVVAMRSSVRGLENRLDRVEQAATQGAGASSASGEELAALRQKVEQLSQAAGAGGGDVEALRGRVAELENSRAAASTVLSLSERLGQVEAQARDASSREERALTFLMSTLALREAVAAGRPYEAELRALRVTAPQDIDLSDAAEGFLDHAQQGVAPLVVLRQRLAAMGEEIIRATARPEEGDGWLNRTVDRALSVVSVRRTDGEAVGDGTAAIVSRAERRLEAGNLAAAVGELTALQGAPAEAAAPWLRDARARLAADAAVSELTAEALARVGSRPQAATGQEG